MQFLRRQRKGRKRKTFLEKIGLNDRIRSADKFHEHYTILNQLEGGGQGTIHDIKPKANTTDDSKLETEGNETHSEIKLVVKIMDMSDFDDIEMELIHALNKYELTSTKTFLLNHHGIYYDEKQRQLLIVTEKLKSNLAQFKDYFGSKINEEQLRSIMSDLLMKLHMLHSTGHVHCDINPWNVMCDDKNEWKLIDFDMMMKVDDKKGYATDCWKGTIGWVSKEIGSDIHSSNNQYSFSSDIWSLGLVLLYILNDFKNPFELSPHEIAQNQLNEESDRLEYYYKYKMTEREYEAELQCLLITWFATEKISFGLYDLLWNHLLVFDVRRRAQSCVDVMFHPWFHAHMKQHKHFENLQIKH
eukprot:19891_1